MHEGAGRGWFRRKEGRDRVARPCGSHAATLQEQHCAAQVGRFFGLASREGRGNGMGTCGWAGIAVCSGRV